MQQGEQVIATYGYDIQNRRFRKTVGSTTTYYLYNLDDQLIAEISGSGTVLREYVWLDGEPFLLAEYTGTNAGTYFYLNDHLGTPQQLLKDETGAMAWQAAYLPFGEAQVQVGRVMNNLRFPGQYYDAETGLHYNWNRYYDPKSGRYVSADPIGLDGGINTYNYVDENPVIFFDINGLIKWHGSVFQMGGVHGVGYSYFVFNVTSECINNKKAEVTVKVHAGSTGFGQKVSTSFGGTDLEDYDNIINPNNLSGSFRMISAGITFHPPIPVRYPGESVPIGRGPGVGLSVSYYALGKAFSNIMANPGVIVGYDFSITGSIGNAEVVKVKYSCCE